MKTRYPARTALVTALALAFGASVFAADQVSQSTAASTDRSGTTSQDATRSSDPQVNSSQSGFNDWTQPNNSAAETTRGNAQDTTTGGTSALGTDGDARRSDRGATGAVGGSSYDATQRADTPSGTRSNAQNTTTGGSNVQDRTSGAGTTGTMRDGMSRDAAGPHWGTMTDGGSMGEAMRRHHDVMLQGDAAAQQDRLNQIEPGASDTRGWLYPESGNAQAD